jgi:hypothetical protein
METPIDHRCLISTCSFRMASGYVLTKSVSAGNVPA